MPDGAWTEREFELFGYGLTHMAVDAEQHEECSTCNGQTVVGGTLKVACPACGMTGRVKK